MVFIEIIDFYQLHDIILIDKSYYLIDFFISIFEIRVNRWILMLNN